MYYLYGLAGHVVTEINSSGGWNRGEVYAGGKHLATYVGGTIYFDQGDWLGTERARTDATGAVAETCSGLPFGDDMNCTAGGISPLYFTGKQRDTETGLDYFGARYSASKLGRFMTPDPIGPETLKGKALLAHQIDPQDWNKYAYALDNPMTLTDPTGLNACNPFDKSQTDCKVTIVIKDRSTDRSGKYNDQFTNVGNQQNYNATAAVYVNGKLKGTFLIRTIPSSGKYGTVKAGTYSGTYINHRGKYPAILLTGKGMGFGLTPALGGKDPFTGLPYVQDAEIHSAGLGNFTGMYKKAGSWRGISEGCSLVCRSQYPSFEGATGLTAPAPQTAFTILLDATANGGQP